MGNFATCGISHHTRMGRTRHHHRFWELCHYVEGEGVLAIGGHRIPFEPGTMVLIPPFLEHSDGSGGSWSNQWFHFRQWPGQGREIRVVTKGLEDPFAPLLALLRRESQRRNSCSDEVLDLVLRLLARQSQVITTDLVEDLKERLMKYLYFPEEPLTTIFSGRPESLSTLTRRFRAREGVSPMAYLIRQRMAVAKRYLQDGWTVGAVARKLGYGDHSYFARLYRQKMGHAPHLDVFGQEKGR